MRLMCMLLIKAILKTVAEKPPHTKFLASLGSACAAARKLCVNKLRPEPKTVVKSNRAKFPKWKKKPAARL